MIEVGKIEAHSKICTAPTYQVIHMAHSSELKQILFKLTKLKSSIEAIVYSGQILAFSLIEENLKFLIKKTNDLLFLNQANLQSVEKSTSITSQLRKLSKDLPGKFLVYSDRIKFLSIELTYCLVNGLRENENKGGMSLGFIRRDSEKKIRENPFAFACEGIDEVKSVVESRTSIKSSMGSPGEDDEESPLSTICYERASIQEKNELKKYFYSKCLVVKLSFSSRHPAQYIQIPQLYEKVIKNNIPVEWWEDSIRDEFKHPERWVNLSVIPNDTS